jgi:RNA polymerase sigma-70 factor (ECF subfamily)
MTDLHDTAPPHDPRADELLAIRCQLGERAAFAELVARWHEPLWRYVRRSTGGDDVAADTVQDVWLRVLRAMPRLRDPARLRAWLFGIARRAVLDRVRWRYAEPHAAPIDDVEALSVGAAETDEDLAEALALMHGELARLPFAEREVLALFYLRELTLAQLAEVLGVPVGTVKSRLFRARQLMRRHLIERGIER